MEIPPSETQHHPETSLLRSFDRMPPRSPIFFGRDGLRAGWSILLYIVVIAALLSLAGFELHWFAVHLHQTMSGEFHPTLAILTEATTLLVVVLATALMAWIEGRGVAFYGLIGIDRVRQFFIGIVSGFVLLSLLVAILVATHHLDLSREHAPLGRTIGYAAAWALFFFLVGMTEELMLRGYLLFTLARGIWFWLAAIRAGGALWVSPRRESWRKPDGRDRRGPGRAGVLAQFMASGPPLVGDRLSCGVGLGGVILLWHRRQRHRFLRAPDARASFRRAAAERGRHGP